MSPAGVTFLDHTADVGMDVEAPSLERLLDRAAAGMLALLRGEDDGGSAAAWSDAARTGRRAGSVDGTGGLGSRRHSLELEADDPAGLLAEWLRELLFLHEVRHLDYAAASFEILSPRRLSARVELEPARRPVREIKGVTYHEIGVWRTPDGWRARVIFDV